MKRTQEERMRVLMFCSSDTWNGMLINPWNALKLIYKVQIQTNSSISSWDHTAYSVVWSLSTNVEQGESLMSQAHKSQAPGYCGD